MVRGGAGVVVRAWCWPAHIILGWLLLAGPGCWQHMAHAAVRAFCTTENDKNKKKISGTPRALSSISFNNQLLILRTKNREAE